ncbi:MAG: hypothetical protein E7657_00680 [Ruminococcaceae bacterium]|nr:hypothetical protein [Oscillospiraceae bacterium]
MKKKLLFLSLLLAVAMLLTCVFVFGVGAEEAITMTDVAAGTKTPVAGDTVTIADATELKAFSAYVSKGGVTQGITFKLDSSIDSDTGIVLEVLENANNTNFNPIGGVYNGSMADAVPFLGTFDGNGKAISGLIFTDRYYTEGGTYVSSGANTQNLGFFALLGNGATVKNLTLGVKSVQGVAGPYFGVLASAATGATVTNCAVIGETASYQMSGFSTGFTAAGGLLGSAHNSVIDRCKVNVMINATRGSAAGIVGYATDNTEISNCVAGGTYTHTAAAYLGGIVAKLDNNATVKNCYSSASLISKNATEFHDGDFLGGIAGYVGVNATVENCSSAATMATKTGVAGLLAGNNLGTVKDSYALRDPQLDGTSADALGKPHIHVATGTTVHVYAFEAKTEGDVTTYVLGSVAGGTGRFDCPITGGARHPNNDRSCEYCGGRGWYEATLPYTFTAKADAPTDLLTALNGWIDGQADGAEKYVEWFETDLGVINCDHGVKPAYKAYADKAPTCSATGVGDKLCSICNLLLEENAEIPEDPAKHSQAIYACMDYNCEYCGELVLHTMDHKIDFAKACGEQLCQTCGETVPPTPGVAHTRPAEGEGSVADPERPCLEYTCAACGDEHAHDVEHELPEIDFACREGIKCEKCDREVAPTKRHRYGLPATCTRTQYCLDCRKVIRKAKGHTWGDPATCGSPQVCLDCGIEGAPATGEHIYDRHAPGNDKVPVSDCINPSVCVECGYIGKYALGHSVVKTAATCGLGQSCARCSAVVAPASGDHIIDLTHASVVRSATADRSGILEGTCLDCGRRVEAYTTSAVMEKTGNVLISGGSFTFYAGSRVEAEFGKVADYKELDYKRGYIPLQVVTISSVVDIAGSEIALPGGLTIKIALNKSAAQMSAETFKLYKVEGEELTEIELASVEDGFLVFGASALGTFILAGDEDAAFEVLGAVLPEQPQQTAALIGTASYEKREFEI